MKPTCPICDAVLEVHINEWICDVCDGEGFDSAGLTCGNCEGNGSCINESYDTCCMEH